MSFRPLPAQASTQLLRQARPLQMLFAEAQRICRLQHLLEIRSFQKYSSL